MNRPKVVPDSELEYDSDLIFTHEGEIFTGVGFEETPETGRQEISYRDGMQDGWTREWYPSKVLRDEAHYIQGVSHGLTREFDPAGNLIKETSHEYGIRILTREFDSSGQVIAIEELDPHDGAARYLERLRIERNWGPPPGVD